MAPVTGRQEDDGYEYSCEATEFRVACSLGQHGAYFSLLLLSQPLIGQLLCIELLRVRQLAEGFNQRRSDSLDVAAVSLDDLSQGLSFGRLSTDFINAQTGLYGHDLKEGIE